MHAFEGWVPVILPYLYMNMLIAHTRVDRLCSKTITIGNLTIPEGAIVDIPIHFIHHNPEHWPDPYKFDPERYLVYTGSLLVMDRFWFLIQIHT